MQIYPNPLKVGDTTYSGTQNSDARNISRNAGKSYNILQQSAHDSQESTSPSLIVERAHHIYNGRHVSSIDTLSSDDGMEEKPTKTRSNLGICAMRELRHHKKWPLYSPAQLALGSDMLYFIGECYRLAQSKKKLRRESSPKQI